MQFQGKPVVADYVEHVPPDTTAAIFWLKNRRPNEWRANPEGGDSNDQPITRIEVVTVGQNAPDKRD